MKDAALTPEPNPGRARIDAPALWTLESAALAREYAYTPPASTGGTATLLAREYETNVRNVARSQAALAAARLAHLLNRVLP